MRGGPWRLIPATLLALALLALVACRSAGTVPLPASSSASPAPFLAQTAATSSATMFTTLSADEIDAIVAHGPWPVPFTPDPGNRFSGQPAAIELGRRLFTDPRLSADGKRACISCHQPDRGFADGLARSVAAHGGPLDRNAQGLLDVRLQHWFGWDGAADSLWAFVLRPLGDDREMGAGPSVLAALMAGDPELSSRYRMLDPNPDPSRLRVDIAKALAAYLETLESPRTRFDTLRDALARGDPGATADYPSDALRGLQLFVGRGRCNLCHIGPAFSNGEFNDIGRPFMVNTSRPDPGRHAGVKAVLTDPYNRLGKYVDAIVDPMVGPTASTAPLSTRPDSRGKTVDDPAVRTRHLAPAHRNFGEFRVPGLRGALLTAPYGHDGSLPALTDVVRHYSEIDLERLHADGESLLRPLHLDAQQSADLIAFLRTLSEPERRPQGVSPLSPRPDRAVP
jgi:cytochrome c peroxidase